MPEKDVKDYLGQTLNPGDKVVILYKQSCVSGLKEATLIKGFYIREGRWGSEFHVPEWRGETPLRIRNPGDRIIKIAWKEEK